MRQVTDLLGRLILALILAVLVWVIAIQEGDPTRVDVFPQALPITLLNQPADTIVYNKSANEARVTLRAPSSMWNRLASDQISVTVNLASQPYDTLNLPLQAHVNNPIVQVVQVEPPEIRLSLEPAMLHQVPVSLTLSGEPALGYTIRAWTTTPSEVTVFGPASRVNQVRQARGTLSVQDRRQDVETTVHLSARDAGGATVEGVTLSPQVVQAQAVVEQLGGFRDLTVLAIITGHVASGYRISNISVSPPIVTVFGSSQVIDSLPGYVETVPINVGNAQGRVTERAPINLPGGISLLGDPSVVVDVAVEAIQSGLTLQLRPVVQGLSPTLDAIVSPEYVDLVLTGPLPRLQTLRPGEDVRVVVNVARLKPGTHSVTPHIIVPEGVIAESILPAIIQVTIGPVGSLSPLPTPSRPKPTVQP